MAGGMHGRGACMAGGHAWHDTTRYGDTVNEQAVRILLECILVFTILGRGGGCSTQELQYNFVFRIHPNSMYF